MENIKASLTASIASVLVFTPFDTLRTLSCIQDKQIPMNKLAKMVVQQNGFRGLYRGLGMTLMTSPISTSLYLGIYEQMKKYFNFDSNSLTVKAGTSILAGAIVNTVTNPLYLIKTKIQANTNLNSNVQQQQQQMNNNNKPGKFNNLKNEVQSIYQNQGIRGYYKGLGSSYLGLSHVAVYFTLYEEFKQKMLQSKNGDKLNSQEIFMTSSLAKAIAIFTTYPTTVITTKLQIIEQQNLKALQLIKNIYRQQGIKGFFQGMKIETIRSLPANALTFMIYEKVKLQKKLI